MGGCFKFFGFASMSSEVPCIFTWVCFLINFICIKRLVFCWSLTWNVKQYQVNDLCVLNGISASCNICKYLFLHCISILSKIIFTIDILYKDKIHWSKFKSSACDENLNNLDKFINGHSFFSISFFSHTR